MGELTPADEEELLRRSAGGDRHAFGRLATAHRDVLLSVAARIVGDRAAAQDVVQEALARAWVKAPEWRRGGGARYRTWLIRVTINRAIDVRRRPVPDRLDTVGDPTDPAPDAEAISIDRRRLVALAAAVADLPARQRAAVALRYDAEMTNAEAAAALETSVGAVELLLVRARRTLRQRMVGWSDR